MCRIRFASSRGYCQFDVLSGIALVILAMLRRSPRWGMNLQEIITGLQERGYRVTRANCSSGVLQPLIRAGIIAHPLGDRTSRYYRLRAWPTIAPLDVTR
jgi:hypothetical protein